MSALTGFLRVHWSTLQPDLAIVQAVMREGHDHMPLHGRGNVDFNRHAAKDEESDEEEVSEEESRDVEMES